MKKEDLLKKIESLKDDEDVNSILKGTDIETEFTTGVLTLDNFKTKVKEDKDFKSYVDSLNDSHHSKAIKTMKEKGTWENEFETELKAKFPNLITDPKDKKLLDYEKRIAAMEAKEKRTELLKEAVKYAKEKKLPDELVEKFLGDDLDTTKTNLDGLVETWSKSLELAMDSQLKNGSYTPPGGGEGGSTSIGASFAKQRNSTKSNGSDPWNKE